MAATPAMVQKLDLAGEFSGISDEIIQCIIDDDAVPRVGEIWGDCRDQATTLMAAHILARRLKGSSAPAGPVVSQSAGGLSRTYAGPSGPGISDNLLMSTTYGQDYLALAAKIPTTPLTLCG